MNLSLRLRSLGILLFVTLLWGASPAAAAQADCLGEKERLTAREAEQCDGLGYFFNPSDCIRARKALAAFDAGSCREPAAETAPRQPAVQPAAQAETSPRKSGAVAAQPVIEARPVSSEALTAASGPAVEQLQREIAAMKLEIELLRREVAEIKAGRK